MILSGNWCTFPTTDVGNSLDGVERCYIEGSLRLNLSYIHDCWNDMIVWIVCCESQHYLPICLGGSKSMRCAMKFLWYQAKTSEVCKLWGILLKATSPYCPAQDSMHCILSTYLLCIILLGQIHVARVYRVPVYCIYSILFFMNGVKNVKLARIKNGVLGIIQGLITHQKEAPTELCMQHSNIRRGNYFH